MSSAPANLSSGDLDQRAELPESVAIPVSRYAVFVGISVCGCALDLLAKQWIFQWRGLPRPHNVWWIWDGYFGIETALNTGALFGLGGGYSHVFAGLSGLAAVGIVIWLFRYRGAMDLLLTIALACVMAGIGGNLYDRLGLWCTPDVPEPYAHAVRDWILLRYKGYTWPNFNVADMLLVSGAILLIWQGFIRRPDAAAGDSEANQAV